MKTYADESEVAYTYTPDGRLKTRTWARGISTTYGYDEDTGDLASVDYSDGTPNVTFERDRLGRISTAADAVGARTLTYDPDHLQLTDEYVPGIISRTITRAYAVAGPVIGRPTGLNVGTEYSTSWYYDDDTNRLGRLERVTGPGLPAYGAVYGYESDSDLVAVTGFMSNQNTTLGTATRTFETHRDVVTDVENRWDSTPTLVSKYHYASDALARRTSVVTTGTAYGAGRWTEWLYNGQNELTESRRYEGTTVGDRTQPVNTQQFVFDYDPIGNRLLYQGDGLEGAKVYDSNSLNQYNWTTGPDESFTYDADGNLTQDGKQTYCHEAPKTSHLEAPPKPAILRRRLLAL